MYIPDMWVVQTVILVVAVMMYISECKPNDFPFGRRLHGSVSTVGSSASLACDAGFVPNITVVTCTADGTWQPSTSACVIGIANWFLKFDNN